MIKPLLFVVMAMRNIGQQEWGYDYDRLKDYTKVYSGPEYVSITLKPVSECSEDEGKTEIKLRVTEEVAKRFRLGSTVELWPEGGPTAQKKTKEIDQLMQMFKGESKS